MNKWNESKMEESIHKRSEMEEYIKNRTKCGKLLLKIEETYKMPS